MNNVTAPVQRTRLTRLTLAAYDWGFSPREEYDHAGGIYFAPRAGSRGDGSAAAQQLQWALRLTVKSLRGKFSLRRAAKANGEDIDAYGDDEDTINEMGMETIELMEFLRVHYNTHLRKNIPMWIPLYSGGRRGYDSTAGEPQGSLKIAGGVWFITTDTARYEYKRTLTRAGNMGKRTLKALRGCATAEVSEYLAWANDNAVEVIREDLPASATRTSCFDHVPGILSDPHTIERLEEQFALADAEGDIEPDYSGAWFVDCDTGTFPVTLCVGGAIPRGTTDAAALEEVAAYLTREWRHGYADPEGVWHYVVWQENYPLEEQLPLPLATPQPPREESV